MGHWLDHFQGVFVEYDYKVGTIINEQAPADSLEAKQPYVDNGIGIVDKSRYYDRDFMALEWERLWTKTWQIAAVTADLPEVGSYSVFDIGRESIIIVRTQTSFKAFYNACAHRGTRLVQQALGNKLTFVCPFHFWRYSSVTGELLNITDETTFREEVVCDRAGLTELACEELAGIVFVNMSNNPAPLAESIGLPEGYDKKTGELLWRERLELPPYAVPMTYMHEGKQYIAVAAGGTGEPGALYAYSLP